MLKARKLRKYGIILDDQYIESWNSYQKQQKVTKRKIRDAVAKQEKAMVEDIRKKGEENSRELYTFLRGEKGEEKEIVGQEQNSFREDRRGEDNLYVVKELINRCVEDKQGDILLS